MNLTQKAYLVGVHHYAYRTGEAAEIIGVKYVKPEGYDWRLAYEVVYSDGKTDTVAYADVEYGNFVIISDVQLALGQIPSIDK